jgi:hypothetical protein
MTVGLSGSPFFSGSMRAPGRSNRPLRIKIFPKPENEAYMP